MKIFWVIFLFCFAIVPVRAVDFLHNLPEPLKSVNDVNHNSNSLEQAEAHNPFEFIRVTLLGPAIKNDALTQLHSFLAISNITFGYRVRSNLEIRSSALVYQKNTLDDSIVAGHVAWADQAILADITFGIRNFFGEFFFIGVGVGSGIFVGLKHNTLSELILERIFVYQEFGVNLRTSSRSIYVALIDLNIGHKLSGTPVLITQRANLINGSIGFRWQYLF